MVAIEDLYTSIYSQEHSQHHGIMVAGNNTGKLLVFDLSNLLQNEECQTVPSERPSGPISAISAHSHPIYSLCSNSEFAIAGTSGKITFWRWDDLANSSSVSPSSVLTIPIEGDQTNFGIPEVNSLSLNGDRLYAGCGDWKTRLFDIGTGKLTATLEGHSDYVHQVVAKEAHSLLTCGEDGVVLVWDVRTPKLPVSTITPGDHQELDRPYLGKFIRCVDHCGGEWVVCGGGPRAGVFHLRSSGLIATLPPSESDAAVTVTSFVKENDTSTIVTAGSGTSTVSVCNLSGEVTAKIPSSSRCIYSVKVSYDTHLVMSIAGIGSKVDMCRNLNYRDHSVSTLLSQ